MLRLAEVRARVASVRAKLDVGDRSRGRDTLRPPASGRRRPARAREFQQQERRLIGPVEVVEHENQRPRVAGVAQEGRDAVEEAKARLLRWQHRASPEIGEAIADLRDHLSDVGRTGAHGRHQRRGVVLLYE